MIDCAACQEPKLESEMSCSNGYPKWCKACVNVELKHWRLNNMERFRATQRRSVLKRKYGLTPEDHAAMAQRQDGRCAICRALPPKGTTLHVDHCHATGRVRGLLCVPCNLALGLVGDRLDVLGRAAEYIEQSGFSSSPS